MCSEIQQLQSIWHVLRDPFFLFPSGVPFHTRRMSFGLAASTSQKMSLCPPCPPFSSQTIAAPPPHLLIQPLPLSLQNGALHTAADSLHNSLNLQQQEYCAGFQYQVCAPAVPLCRLQYQVPVQGSSTMLCASAVQPRALPATKPVESSLWWPAEPRAV